MTAFQMKSLKDFTAQLFLHELFDSFLFFEAEFRTYANFNLDGRRNLSFYREEEQDSLPNRSYLLWREIRPLCLQIIRGNRLPLSFKIVLLSPYSDPSADLFLNIRYDQEKLLCITGTSFHEFTLDKTREWEWDAQIAHFFAEKQLDFEPC